MKPPSVAYLYELSAEDGQRPARQARAHERIAEEIGAQIRDGRLVRGQKLPTEREMSERFGVGRGVVREAVRMLDAMGLVESRQGSGIYVRNNPIPSISRALTLSVTPEEQSVTSLFEFRTVLEVAAVERAALRRTEEQLAAIEDAAIATVDAAPDFTGDVWHLADQEFHRAISDASGNPYISVAIDAVRQMQRDVTRLVQEMRGSVGAAEQHRAIAEGIAARCPARAAAAMRAHIQYSADRWQQAQKVAREAGGKATESHRLSR
ncbi:MAG: FadR family transcriptional regulator [Thermomicrobia bacterium]|nr:FadR family transcriptional regulator [Thermomicrobia bacterium]